MPATIRAGTDKQLTLQVSKRWHGVQIAVD